MKNLKKQFLFLRSYFVLRLLVNPEEAGIKSSYKKPRVEKYEIRNNYLDIVDNSSYFLVLSLFRKRRRRVF